MARYSRSAGSDVTRAMHKRKKGKKVPKKSSSKRKSSSRKRKSGSKRKQLAQIEEIAAFQLSGEITTPSESPKLR